MLSTLLHPSKTSSEGLQPNRTMGICKKQVGTPTNQCVVGVALQDGDWICAEAADVPVSWQLSVKRMEKKGTQSVNKVEVNKKKMKETNMFGE